MRWRICTLARKPSCENAEDGGASRHIHEKLFEVIVEVNNAGWLRAQTATERERDVDRIFSVVFAGDEQLRGQTWEFRALTDGIGPQAVVLA